MTAYVVSNPLHASWTIGYRFEQRALSDKKGLMIESSRQCPCGLALFLRRLFLTNTPPNFEVVKAQENPYQRIGWKLES